MSVLPYRRLNERSVVVSTLLLLAACSTFAGCRHAVRGQPIPERRLAAKPSDFPVDDPGLVVLHYYGVGGWGILWKGSYLLTAPYFSNHDLWDSSLGVARPKRSAIDAGFRGTPIGSTSVILVGHGHVDHASDIPAYPAAVLARRPTLVADASTMRLLGQETRSKVCAVSLPLAVGGDDGWLPTSSVCPTGDFRIRPLPWGHAPHTEIAFETYLTFGSPQGTQPFDLAEPPQRGNDWLVGRPWAYVIELLDRGEPVFRIHYVDSAASPGFVAPPPLDDATPTDVHIACMPGFDLVAGYPGELIAQQQVRYVLAGHWEDFFRSRDRPLRPVAVLDEDKMEDFVTRVETAIGPLAPNAGPVNKEGCTAGETCGPHGTSWTVPVPGETFWFRSASATGDAAAVQR